MAKLANKALGIAAASLALVLTAPVSAATANLQTDGFEETIAQAKSQMVANPAAAYELALEAKALASGNNQDTAKDRVIAQWLEGEALMRLNRSEEAAGTIEQALAVASEHFEDDKIYADLLRSSASVKARSGQLREALAQYELANDRYQRLGEQRSSAIILQNIGSLYSQARKYEEALDYYRQASVAFPEDMILTLSARNNTGHALKGLGRHAEAEAEFELALAIAREMQSPVLEARILTNIASAQFLQGKTDKADATAAMALALASEHAADWTPFIFGVMAQIEFDRGNLAEAEECLAKTFANQELDSTNPLFKEFHQTASEVFASNGNTRMAQRHRAAFDRIESQSQGLDI